MTSLPVVTKEEHQHCRTVFGRRAFYVATQIWNQTPLTIRTSPSLNSVLQTPP